MAAGKRVAAYVESNSTIELSTRIYLLADFRGLVLGCIVAKLRTQILVEKLLTRSIRFTIFQDKVAKFCNFRRDSS